MFVCGLNHKTAPLEIREQCVFAHNTLSRSLHTLVKECDVTEAAILSTCNRTEIYCDHGNPAQLHQWLQSTTQQNITDYLYIHEGDEALSHLLRVASGIDSLILGEPQILGQLKQAYQLANQAGTIGRQFNRLFQYVFSVAKTIRSQTAIGRNPVSIAYAAVQLAKQSLTDLQNKRVLLIGAGQTASLVAQYLKDEHIKSLFIANRDVIKATQCAERFSAQGICLGAIDYHINQVDLIITATHAPEPIITFEQIAKSNQPLVLLDLAVPRNIDHHCSELPHTTLFTIDDLSSVIKHNKSERQKAAIQAEQLIKRHVDAFNTLLNSLSAVQTICDYRDKTRIQSDQILQQSLTQLEKGHDPETIMKALHYRLRQQLMHGPTQLIRELGKQHDWGMLNTLQMCFDLKSSELSD